MIMLRGGIFIGIFISASIALTNAVAETGKRQFEENPILLAQVEQPVNLYAVNSPLLIAGDPLIVQNSSQNFLLSQAPGQSFRLSFSPFFLAREPGNGVPWAFPAGDQKNGLNQTNGNGRLKNGSAEKRFGGFKKWFHANRPSLGLTLRYEYRDRRRTRNSVDSYSTLNRFSEELSIGVNGWVYSPRFMKYDVLFAPEFIQDDREGTYGFTYSSTGFSPDYFFNTYFLPDYKYTLRLFAERTEEPQWDIDGGFSDYSDIATTQYGANFNYKRDIFLPFSIGYRHVTNTVTNFDTLEYDRDVIDFQSVKNTPKTLTHLTGFYLDETRTDKGTNFGDGEQQNFRALLRNTYQVGATRKSNLYSTANLNYLEQNGRDFQSLLWTEKLRLYHTDNLRSDSRFQYRYADYSGFYNQSFLVDAQLQHYLYDNLVTTVGANGGYTFTENDQQTIDLGSLLNFQYTRTIPWGTIGSIVGWTFAVTDTGTGDGSTISVIDERHVLRSSAQTFLRRNDIDLGSIVVSDVSGQRIYIENLDYFLEVINGSVLIRRAPFGSIRDGAAVLVDYNYKNDYEVTSGRFGQHYNIYTYLWNSLFLNYDLSVQTNEVFSGGDTSSGTGDEVRHAGRIEYQYRWSRTWLELENVDRDPFASWQRWQLRELITLRFPYRINLKLSGYYGETEFDNEDQARENYGGNIDVSWTPVRWCTLSTDGFYDNQQYPGAAYGNLTETGNMGLRASIIFRYRIWSARLYYELSEQTADYGRNDSSYAKEKIIFEIIRIRW